MIILPIFDKQSPFPYRQRPPTIQPTNQTLHCDMIFWWFLFRFVSAESVEVLFFCSVRFFSLLFVCYLNNISLFIAYSLWSCYCCCFCCCFACSILSFSLSSARIRFKSSICFSVLVRFVVYVCVCICVLFFPKKIRSLMLWQCYFNAKILNSVVWSMWFHWARGVCVCVNGYECWVWVFIAEQRMARITKAMKEINKR